MPSTLSLHDAPPADLDGATLLLLGRKGTLRSSYMDTLATRWVSQEVWTRMVEGLRPGDSGASTTTHPESGPHKLVAAALPERVGRGNSKSRAWAIPGLVRSATSKGRLVVCVAMEQKDYALATIAGIARACPAYCQKSNPTSKRVEVVLGTAEGPFAAKALQPMANGVRNAAAWVDMAPNQMTVDRFVDEAKRIAELDHRVRLEVLRGEELKTKGMGGIWGVGKAAVCPPALIHLDYAPSSPMRHSAWVGKGIVFDTGGLSIKGKTAMPSMKMDMGGAAALLAAFETAVALGAKERISCILCVAENAVGRHATRPDDILRMYSGKTVEVNNTDAEGRLVLADGVAYVSKHIGPDRIIDMATLTGAQGVSTGRHIAALVCNDEALELEAIAAGMQSGDLCHPLPYIPEFHRKEFRSQVADMKNSVKDRGNAQSSCAGYFVSAHLGDYKGPWLHIDMAGPAMSGGRGTGFGVALMIGLTMVNWSGDANAVRPRYQA